MKIKKTQFIKSSTSLEECPKGDFPEFVFPTIARLKFSFSSDLS